MHVDPRPPDHHDPVTHPTRLAAIIRQKAHRVPAFSPAILVVALLLAVAALVIACTGGAVWSVGGVRISARTPLRPFFAALLLAGIAWWVSPAEVAEIFAPIRRVFVARMNILAGVMALAIVIVGVQWGTHAASGADSYGYVSQAAYWLSGHLIVPEPHLHAWPFSEWTLSPLGYRPGPMPHTIVPLYSPGLPLLMAAATAVVGTSGPFVVVPLLGGLAILLTFLLGRLLFNRTVGLIASLWLAVSPAFLFQLMWPMSDVPALTGWTLALVFGVLRRPLAAGLAAGCAVLIRPNLVPLAIPIVLLVSLPARWDRAAIVAGFRRALIASVGLLPAVIGIALFYQHLFGSPLRSGYGSPSTIYHWRYLLPNLARYPVWLVETETPLVVLAALPFLSKRFRSAGRASDDGRIRNALLLFLAIMIASYLFYLPFNDWSYLRFILPIYPLLLILAAGAAWTGLDRLAPRWKRWSSAALAIAVLAIGLHEASYAVGHGVLDLQRLEQRYVTIGRALDAAMAPNAVILSMQESGSVRYYGHRLTIRYDEIPPSRLDMAIGLLEAGGYHPYFLLEDWEEPKFRRRFARHTALGALDWDPVMAWSDPVTVRLYDAVRAPRDSASP